MRYNETTKFSNPRHEALMGVWWSGLLMKQAARHLFRKTQLTETQFNVLLLLKVADKPLSQQQLSERLLVDKSNLTGLIDRMEAAGLIVRKRADRDRRCYSLEMTKKGRALLEKVEPEYVKHVEHIMAPFTQEEISGLLSYMLRLHSAIEETMDEKRPNGSRST